MAHLDVSGMDDVLNMLDKLSKKQNVDNAAKKAVEAAKGKLTSATKASLSASETGPHATGSVSASIQATSAKINAYGAYSVARPTGRDAKGVRNGEKAAYLEYGTPKMAARPWRARAIASAEGPCTKIMEEVIAKEFGAQ